jgi:SAM-dependent methyltransferase
MSHYDQDYLEWQSKFGRLSGRGNLFLYRDHIRPQDNVIDFGCGGGFILANIKCKGKLGIEINPEARKLAAINKVEAVQSPQEVPDDWADVIISCHALEHTHRPLDELQTLYPKLKKGGKIIFVVPYERKNPYKLNDINQHLYTWSEMNLGNLFTHAGYVVKDVKEVRHRFPPYSYKLIDLLGDKLFYFASLAYGNCRTGITQVRIIAEKL